MDSPRACWRRPVELQVDLDGVDDDDLPLLLLFASSSQELRQNEWRGRESVYSCKNSKKIERMERYIVTRQDQDVEKFRDRYISECNMAAEAVSPSG